MKNKKTQEEVWKDVVGFEGQYKVSNLGRIKSFRKSPNPDGKIISPYTHDTGYHRVTVSRKGRELLHRLIAIAFIPNPENKAEINHIDGNKQNNNVTNLEWSTHSENIKHSYRVLGRKLTYLGIEGKNHPRSLPIKQFDINGKFIRNHDSGSSAIKYLRKNGWPLASKGNLSSALRNRTKSSYGYKWEFLCA